MAHTSFSSFLSWAGKFFTALFLLTIFIVFETCAFTLNFVLSHFSVVWKTGGAMTQQTISQYFLWLEVGSVLGGGIYAGGWICVLFFLFLAWLFFPHPVFVLENNGVMSHFLTSWLLSLLLSCFLFVITIKVNIKTDYNLFNLKIILASSQIILLLGSCLPLSIP